MQKLVFYKANVGGKLGKGKAMGWELGVLVEGEGAFETGYGV